MLLQRIRVHNVCQIDDLKVKMKPGLIGVLGPCGSGKSNFLGAMRATLTNDFSFGGTKKSSKVQRGVSDSAPSYVSAVWEHKGVEAKVRRDVRPSKSLLKVDGHTLLTKQAEIAALFQKLFGVTQRMLTDYVFVDQWKMREFFSLKPSERMNAFAHLCGADFAENIWTLLGTQLGETRIELQTLEQNRPDSLEDLREVKRDLEEQAFRLEKRRTTLSNKVLSDKERQTLEQQLTDAAELARLVVSIKKLKVERQGVTEKITQRRVAANADQKNVDEGEKCVETLGDEMAKTRQELEKLEELQARFQRKLQLEKREEQLLVSKPEPKLSKPDKTVLNNVAYTDTTAAMDSELLRAKKILKEFSGEDLAECPTCGTTVDSIDLTSAQKAVAELPDKVAYRRRRWREASGAREALDEWRREDGFRKRSLDIVREELATLESVKPPRSKDELALAVAEFDAIQKKLKEDKRKFQISQTALSRAEAERSAVHKQIREATKRADKLRSTVSDKNAKQLLDDSRESESKLASVKIQLSGIAEKLADNLEERRRARTFQERLDRLDKWQVDLSSWRDVLHREELPQLFMRSVLEEVVDDMNRLLEDFDGPFRVSVDDGLTFMIHNNDGSVEPSSAKSGGEETVLAIVYRLSINARFANDVGMLVLDEPTAGLDEHYLGCLADVLTRLNEVTKKRRQQVIMVTHDQRLERVFDQLIRFE